VEKVGIKCWISIFSGQLRWNGLSPQQKEALLTAAQKVEDSIWNKYHDSEAEIYTFAASKGIKVQQLVPDDTIAWRVCSSSILESYIERAGALGASLFAAYGKLRTEPCCSTEGNAGSGPK
jgi:TRAP-type C4-dicarboxylate transport system substrate-binding protein